MPPGGFLIYLAAYCLVDINLWPSDILDRNTKHWNNVGLMLRRRRRRLVNVKPTLAQCVVFAGMKIPRLLRSMDEPDLNQVPQSRTGFWLVEIATATNQTPRSSSANFREPTQTLSWICMEKDQRSVSQRYSKWRHPNHFLHYIFSSHGQEVPANTAHSPTAFSMLGHRLRRWPNIENAVGECPVFSGNAYTY